MIPDSLFSPPQSPVFFLLESLVFILSLNPVPVLSVLFLHLEVLSHPPRSPRSPGFVLSPPPPPRSKENSGTTRSRPAVRVVVSSKMEHIMFGRSAK